MAVNSLYEIPSSLKPVPGTSDHVLVEKNSGVPTNASLARAAAFGALNLSAEPVTSQSDGEYFYNTLPVHALRRLRTSPESNVCLSVVVLCGG